MFRFFKSKKKVDFHEQLETLANIGIHLCDSVTEDMVFTEFNKDEFEEEPYLLLLMFMGGEIEITDDHFIDVSKDIWGLDTECIEDHGNYIRIAERIKALSKGLLDIENIKDYIDIEEGEAWLSFTFKGKEYKWQLKVEDDWLDDTILHKFNELLKATGAERKIYVLTLDQNCLIGIFTALQQKQLNQLLKHPFVGV